MAFPDKTPVDVISEQIVGENVKTLSGVRLKYNEMGMGDWSIWTPLLEKDLTDEEVLEWYLKRSGSYTEVLRTQIGRGAEYKKGIIESARDGRQYLRTGGHNVISARDLLAIEKEIPTIFQAVENEKGRIDVIGNGLSPLAILLAERFREGNLSQPPVVCDLYEYRDLLADLINFRKSFEGHKVEYPLILKTFLEIADTIVGENGRGNLVTVRYQFGTKNIPSVLRNADLVVNCFGPPTTTLDEQLSLLARGGRLYITDKIGINNINNSGFQAYPLQRDNKWEATMIRKVS